MILSNIQLREACLDKRIGQTEPYSLSTEAVEAHLHELVSDLEKLESLKLSAVFNHYGNGYASYVDVFCEKTKDRSLIHHKAELHWHGISVYLCRLAPVAIYAAGVQVVRPQTQSRSRHYIRPETIGTTPEGDWGRELKAILSILKKKGFVVLSKEDLVQPLAFEVKIRTNLARPPYKMFDALFHWED